MFPIRLKNLRQSKELNQVQLASKLGVKKQSVRLHGVWRDHELYALLSGPDTSRQDSGL